MGTGEAKKSAHDALDNGLKRCFWLKVFISIVFKCRSFNALSKSYMKTLNLMDSEKI